MGEIIASCGHQIYDLEETHTWEDYGREGQLCLCYGVLCPECKNLFSLVEDVEQWKKEHWGNK